MIPETLINEFNIRNCNPKDHLPVIAVMKSWWNGRDLKSSLEMRSLTGGRSNGIIAGLMMIR
jgi:hypothetical protein